MSLDAVLSLCACMNRRAWHLAVARLRFVLMYFDVSIRYIVVIRVVKRAGACAPAGLILY